MSSIIRYVPRCSVQVEPSRQTICGRASEAVYRVDDGQDLACGGGVNTSVESENSSFAEWAGVCEVFWLLVQALEWGWSGRSIALSVGRVSIPFSRARLSRMTSMTTSKRVFVVFGFDHVFEANSVFLDGCAITTVFMEAFISLRLL